MCPQLVFEIARRLKCCAFFSCIIDYNIVLSDNTNYIKMRIERLQFKPTNPIPQTNCEFYQIKEEVTILIHQSNLRSEDVLAEFVQPDLLKVTILGVESLFDLNGTGENPRINVDASWIKLIFTSTRIPNKFDSLLKSDVLLMKEPT